MGLQKALTMIIAGFAFSSAEQCSTNALCAKLYGDKHCCDEDGLCANKRFANCIHEPVAEAEEEEEDEYQKQNFFACIFDLDDCMATSPNKDIRSIHKSIDKVSEGIDKVSDDIDRGFKKSVEELKNPKKDKKDINFTEILNLRILAKLFQMDKHAKSVKSEL